MVKWYIDSRSTDEKYISRVRQTVEYCMDHLCDRLSNLKEIEIEVIEKVFKDIIEELPILTFCYDKQKDEFYCRYNSSTTIRFDDPLKSIKREIILNKILNNE